MVNNVLYRDTGDYNLTVVATDDGVPPMSDEAQLLITVIRNLNAPVFASNYSQNLSEYAPIGHNVVRVEAYDADSPSSPSGQLTYDLLREPPTFANEYFSLGSWDDPQMIVVNESLRQFERNDMYFRVRAKDGAVPPKEAFSYVHVRILRNEYAPVFGLQDYNATISESHPVRQAVLTVSATDRDDLQQGRNNNSIITYRIDPNDATANR